MAGISKTFDKIEQENLSTIVQIAWVMDMHLLKLTLNGVSSNSAIAYARVNDTRGKLLAESGTLGDGSNVIVKRYPLIKFEHVKKVNIEIGSLLIEADTDVVYNNLRRQLSVIIFTQFFKNIIGLYGYFVLVWSVS